jgi:GNAT superfamily N-acetyltransferase
MRSSACSSAMPSAGRRSLPGVDVSIRQARAEDLDACGRVCYRAFQAIAERHGFPPDFDSEESARLAFGSFVSDPLTYGVVAERGGQVVGSTFIHDRRPVAGVGPVTVDPSAQDAGVGQRMMEAVLEWAWQREFPAIRLVQAAYHTRSLALYAGLGFDVREPLSCLQGPAIGQAVPGCEVRQATEGDLSSCDDLCEMIHGFARRLELTRGIERGSAMVVERGSRITGYASELAFWGHGVGETDDDLRALIAAASSFGGPGFLVPARNAAVLRWCLARGLRIVQPMTLMTVGWYQEPTGAYFPSVGF